MSRTIILIGILILIFISFLLVRLFNPDTTPQSQTEIPLQSPNASPTFIPGTSNRPVIVTPKPVTQEKVSPLQIAVIGTNLSQVQDLLKDASTEQLADGSIKYVLPAAVPLRDNVVIAKNNQIIFEKIITPSNNQANGFSYLSDFIYKFGDPQSIKKGSAVWGPFASYYIYADKGLTVVANPETDEVYEIQVYQPTSVENYISAYGQEIREFNPDDENEHL